MAVGRTGKETTCLGVQIFSKEGVRKGERGTEGGEHEESENSSLPEAGQ
jgi:hypothetical protein